MTSRRRMLAALLLLALVGACGQKGALYLPQEPEPVEPQDQSTPPQREDDAR